MDPLQELWSTVRVLALIGTLVVTPDKSESVPFGKLRSRNRIWKCMPVIPTFGKQRQEDTNFKIILSYIRSHGASLGS